jgi:hypothetical protein
VIKLTEAEGRELPDDPEERVQTLTEVFRSERELRFTLEQPHFPELTETDWAILKEEQEEQVERAVRIGVAAREAAKISRRLGLLSNDESQAEFVSNFISDMRDVGPGTLSGEMLAKAEKRDQVFRNLAVIKADALSDRLLDESAEAENAAGGIGWTAPAPFLAKSHRGIFPRLVEKD